MPNHDCHPAALVRLLVVLAAFLAFSPLAEAQTRRAFVVGVNEYGGKGERELQQLSLAVNDARTVARDLEQLGFDKKNIKVATNVRSKEEFNKQFDAFLKDVQRDDTVFFFFSGHGFGIDATRQNYLLFGNLKSPLAFTLGKLDPKERRNTDAARLRIMSFMDAYQSEEIVKNGISVAEIQERIADRSPRTAILILDACRSIVPIQRDGQAAIRRGPSSGSRMLAATRPPPGFFVLYSASFGEQAVEQVLSDRPRQQVNSLFTEVLREEIMRPGQTLTELGERVRLVVDAVAKNQGQQQTPEIAANLNKTQDLSLTGSIGGEVFRNDGKECELAHSDWREVSKNLKRENLESHIRRFANCPTIGQARRALAALGHGSIEDRFLPVREAGPNVLACDRLAAAPDDRSRPQGVPGVPFDKIGVLNEPIAEDEASKREDLVQLAVKNCRADLQAQPNVARLYLNLARSLQRHASLLPDDDPKRRELLEEARQTYENAARRGNAVAWNNIAIMLDEQGSEANSREATRLFLRAAEQGSPLAMFNLAHRYKIGRPGLPRDDGPAYEWFARAAEGGFVPAMVEAGYALQSGRGVTRRNPRRAAEWFERAAALGSTEAKLALGWLYLYGIQFSTAQDEARLAAEKARKTNQREIERLEAIIATDRANSVPQDRAAALLWFARAAEDGNPIGQARVARMTERGEGLPNAQPQAAQRYWRMAARAGDRSAQMELGTRLIDGRFSGVIEHGGQDARTLLNLAMAQGSAEAALQLARLERDNGTPESKRDALRYAYRALQLAPQANPTDQEATPFTEIQAGHLIVEMFRNGEADSIEPAPVKSDEVERLERFYGRVDRVPDADGKQRVKARLLTVPLGCVGQTELIRIWVWDWGRNESPTETQFRSVERQRFPNCSNNVDLRDTLSAVFDEAKKSRVPFADLIDQRIASAKDYVERPNPRPRR
jgi:TPR repeat protein